MIRQPFVNWNTLETAKPNKAGVSYLVAIPSGETVTYDFAKYLHKGDTVNIDYIKGEHILTQEQKDAMSPEERLLTIIFGTKYEFTAPEDGFYIEFHQDYDDFNDESNEFKDCMYQMVKLNTDTFWSDMPIAPTGFITENEHIARMAADNKNMKMRHDEQRCNDMLDKIDESEFTKITYDIISGHRPVSFDLNEIQFHLGGIYTITTYRIAQNVLSVHQVFELMKYMIDNNVTYQNIGEKICNILETVATPDEANKQIDGVFDELLSHVEMSNVAKAIAKSILYDLKMTYEDASGVPSPYEYRLRAMKKYNNDKEHLAEILINEECSGKIINRYTRLSRLYSLGAPEVIMVNEFRMLAECLMPIIEAKRFTDVNPEIFGKNFGVNADYTRYENCDEYDETDSDDSSDEPYQDDNNGWHGIGYDYPYFAVVKAPAWLMFDGEFAIQDNAKDDYVTDELGNIVLFDNIDDAFNFKAAHGMNK